jgi:hypothetical protein
MSATIQVRSHHTNVDDGGTDVASGTLRFKLADNDVQNTVNPIVRPGGAGFLYSWIKQLRLFASVTPVTTISNIKFFMTGAAPTGVDVMVKTSASYTDPTAQAATALAGTVSGFTYTADAPLSVAGTLTNPSTGQIGSFVQAQLRCDQTGTPAIVGTGAFWFRWDEQ